MVGIDCFSEVPTSDGRIDSFIELSDTIFIFEFKYQKKGEHDKEVEALEQICNQSYHLQFMDRGKPIVGVGVSFSSKTKRWDKHVIKQIWAP